MSVMVSERGKGRGPCYPIIRQEAHACLSRNVCRGNQMHYSNVQGNKSHAGLTRRNGVCPHIGAGCMGPKRRAGFGPRVPKRGASLHSDGEGGMGERAEMKHVQVWVGCPDKGQPLGRVWGGHHWLGTRRCPIRLRKPYK